MGCRAAATSSPVCEGAGAIGPSFRSFVFLLLVALSCLLPRLYALGVGTPEFVLRRGNNNNFGVRFLKFGRWPDLSGTMHTLTAISVFGIYDIRLLREG